MKFKSQRYGHPGIVNGPPRMGYKAKLEGSQGGYEKQLIGRWGSLGGKTEPKSQRCGHPGLFARVPRMGYKAKLEGS